MKLAVYLDFWLNSVEIKRIKSKTYCVYNNFIEKYISPNLGKCEIGDINSKVLNEFVATLCNLRLSRSSICIIISIIKSTMRYYYEVELNRLSPYFKVFIPPYQKKTRIFPY